MMEEGIVREFGMDMYTFLYLKWITNKNLLYSTCNSTQCYVPAWMGWVWGTMDTCICMAKSPHIPPETITTLLIGCTPIQNVFGVKKNIQFVGLGKSLKRWKYQTTWPASWEICIQVRKQQLELDMEQQAGSKSKKEYVKAVYCHPAYLTYMQSTSCEMLGWMKHKLESRLPVEISITSYTQMTPPLWQKAKN